MSNGTLIVLKKNGSEGSRFLIEEDNVYNIGSGFDCHLRFNLDKDIDENVCTISTKKKGTVKIKKITSYPILVNNEEISSPKNLKTGDVIKIGSKVFRWDSEMTESENTVTSSQKKTTSSGLIRMPFAPVRTRRRSSIMKIRKIQKAENLRPWRETSESIVSSKAEADNAKFTVSVSPVKVSSAADCIVPSDKQHKLRSSSGATNTPKTMRTPKGKARTISKIPIACTENTQSVVSNETVKTPVAVCSPLKTPNIKAIKSASKKSASIRKSSDCIMQAKKWKISDITDAKPTSPELFDIDNAENDANVSSDALSTSNASFSKQEETPKLRNASTNKKFITNKSHTELKKVNKKLRRGSLPTETEVDSPVINKLMISAKTVAPDDLSTLSQSDLSTRRSLQKKSQIDLRNISSEEQNLITQSPAIRRSTRKQNSLSPPSDTLVNQSDMMKDDQLKLSTSQQLVSPPNRRSLRMENRLSSVQVNSSLNKSEHKSDNQSIVAQSESQLKKSLHKEQRNSSVKKSDNKESGSQSDFENSPQPRQSLRQNNLNNSSGKKPGKEDQLNNSQSEVLVTRKSLRKEMPLYDISQSELSVTESVQNLNLLDISQPESSRSARYDNVSTRKSVRKNNLLDITENNPLPRTSMRKSSSNFFNISQNISGVGFLNDDNDLIDWDSPESEQNNVPESSDHPANENEDLIDWDDENNTPEVASAKKTTARKVPKSPLNDLSDVKGVKALMKTPGRAPKTPKNDLTDLRGVKQLLEPKTAKSPKNDLTNVAGDKALLETPGRKGKTPKNDLTNVYGVKRLMNPFREPQSPENDLTQVWGCKQLLSTPKIQKSPLNNLTDVKGIRNLLKTPGREVKSPKNDLSDVRGIKRLMNPFKEPTSPANDLTEVTGVKSLFRTPKIQNSPKNDLTSVKGVKLLLKTPGRKQNSPRNDLRDVRGVKQLLAPKLVKSPENDLSDIRGVKQLFKRNNMPRNDLTDVEDVRHLFVTPEKTVNKSVEVEEENTTTRVNSMDDIFNELKYENEPTDSPLSHLRKSPMKTYERKAMSLSPMKRDADNAKLKTRYSERTVQGPSAHVQKWIEELTVLSSNRDDENEVDNRVLPVEPEVSETQSKPINQGVLRTKSIDDVENTSDVDMTPGTRTRRQRMKAADDTKTASPLFQSRQGKTEPFSVEGITKIVPEQDVPVRKRGRPKGTTTTTDIETVPSTRTRRGRGKDAAEDVEVVEQVVLVQKTTRRLRNNEKISVENVEVIQNNAIEDINISDALGVTENEKKKNSRKRTKAETDLDTDTVGNKSSKRQRKEDTSLHVTFDVPDVGTPVEPKRTRRGTKKTGIKTDEHEPKPTVRRGRNTRRKVSDENANDSENVEVATPETTVDEADTNPPVKRGRNTRKKVLDESEEKVEENEPESTQKRGRNTRQKQVKEIEIIVVSDENVEEKTVKSRKKQNAKKIVLETDENDLNAINVPAKPARRTRAAKVSKEIEKTEESEEESTGKRIQRKRRTPYLTDSTADEKAEESIDNSTKSKRRKADDSVAEQEDVNLSAKAAKRTRVNVVKEQEEPVRKSTRTRKVKC